MNIDLSSFGVADYAKLIGNVAVAFGVGFAQGGYITGAVTALVALATLVQHAPGTTATVKA